jgi:hypothetical protein
MLRISRLRLTGTAVLPSLSAFNIFGAVLVWTGTFLLRLKIGLFRFDILLRLRVRRALLCHGNPLEFTIRFYVENFSEFVMPEKRIGVSGSA